MTPGEEALREAARLEAARVYSRTVPEHHNDHPAPAVADIQAARRRALIKAAERKEAS